MMGMRACLCAFVYAGRACLCVYDECVFVCMMGIRARVYDGHACVCDGHACMCV